VVPVHAGVPPEPLVELPPALAPPAPVVDEGEPPVSVVVPPAFGVPPAWFALPPLWPVVPPRGRFVAPPRPFDEPAALLDDPPELAVLPPFRVPPSGLSVGLPSEEHEASAAVKSAMTVARADLSVSMTGSYPGRTITAQRAMGVPHCVCRSRGIEKKRMGASRVLHVRGGQLGALGNHDRPGPHDGPADARRGSPGRRARLDPNPERQGKDVERSVSGKNPALDGYHHAARRIGRRGPVVPSKKEKRDVAARRGSKY
jgi:hypothetical protein